MKRILLGALCAVTTLALLTGCVKTTAAPGGSSSADAPGSAPGSASGPITTLPDPDAKPIPAQLTADWTEDAVSDTWDTAPEAPSDGAAAVTFTADSTVRNFEILSLTTDLAEDGTPSYTLGDPSTPSVSCPRIPPSRPPWSSWASCRTWPSATRIPTARSADSPSPSAVRTAPSS